MKTGEQIAGCFMPIKESKNLYKPEDVKEGSVQTDGVVYKLPYLLIDGKLYENARQASKALCVSVNTLLKRAKANKEGWFYVEA